MEQNKQDFNVNEFLSKEANKTDALKFTAPAVRKRKVDYWKISSIVLLLLLILSIFTQGFTSFGFMGSIVLKTEEIKLTLINDKQCKTCDTSEILAVFNNIFPNLTVETLDFEDKAAQDLVEELNIELLPVFIFDSAIAEAESWKNNTRLQSAFVQAGNKYVVMPEAVGAFHNPLKEICDNRKDDRDNDGKIDCEDDECKEDPLCWKKVEKPKMTVWVESKCPFGTQAINGVSYVAGLMKDKADLEVRYMVSQAGNDVQAMHGPEELAEDKKHICLREEQPDKYWAYVKCYVETGDSASCEITAKVDSNKLKSCVSERSVGLLKKDAQDWATIYVPKGGSGSPSFFLNDNKLNEYAFSQNGRSPENLKSIICQNMLNPAKECSTKLSEENPPRGFGKMGQGSSDTSASAQCG